LKVLYEVNEAPSFLILFMVQLIDKITTNFEWNQRSIVHPELVEALKQRRFT
jgi:hypothetical protein